MARFINYLKIQVLFIACVVLAGPVQANSLRYETALHEANWTTSASPLACRLSHTIRYYGKAEFVRYAGRDIFLRLEIDQGGPAGGQARLVALPSAWQHQLIGRELGNVKYQGGRDAFRFSRLQVRNILASLEQGLRPALKYHHPQSGAKEVEVVLSAINFRSGMEAFRHCMAGLIPLDYASASRTNILFGNGGDKLDKAAKRRLDAIALFVKADQDIKRVRLEGYSDNVGSRGKNYALSRSRALAVREYLLARGVNADMIDFDYYGEHRPAHSNRTKKGRILNRRVQIQLEKGL